MEAYPCCRYVVFQLERGEESGLLHLQGYTELTRMQRFTYLKNNWPHFATCHFEARVATAEQAIAYCQKEETRIAGPWTFGTRGRDTQGKRSDLLDLASELKEGASVETIAVEHPASFIRYGRGIEKLADIYRKIRKSEEPTPEMEIIVLWGQSGSGKTECAKRSFPGAYSFMPQGGQTTWWPDYEGEETIIINEFANNFPFHYALRLLDEYGLKTQTKGGNTTLYAKRFVLTAMEPPTNWWPNVMLNRDALYRRITHCYRFSGRYKEGTSSMEPDRKPFELDNNCGLWLPDEILEPIQPEEIDEMVSLLPFEESLNMDFDF